MVRVISKEEKARIQQAVADYKSGKYSLRKAAEVYKVKRSTLSDYALKPRNPDYSGARTLFTSEEEKLIVNVIEDSLKRSLAVTKELIIKYASEILHEEIRNNIDRWMPSTMKETFNESTLLGKDWYQLFMKRNNLVNRVPESISKSRLNVTEDSIRQWFSDLNQYCTDNNLLDALNDPERLFNLDETGAKLSDKFGHVVAIKGWRNVQQVMVGNEKQTITVLVTVQAAGQVAPNGVVLPYVRLPINFKEEVLLNGVYLNSQTGWMNSEVFFNYMVNIFHPWLNSKKITRPVIVFTDWHASRLDYHLITKLRELEIVLYGIPPNATHIMQPLDVSCFAPLKNEWRKILNSIVMAEDSLNTVVTKSNFAKYFLEAIANSLTASTIMSGFKRTGIFPLDPDAPNYSKVQQTNTERATIYENIVRNGVVDKSTQTLAGQNTLQKSTNTDAVLKVLGEQEKIDVLLPRLFKVKQFKTYEINEAGVMTTKAKPMPYAHDDSIIECSKKESLYNSYIRATLNCAFINKPKKITWRNQQLFRPDIGGDLIPENIEQIPISIPGSSTDIQIGDELRTSGTTARPLSSLFVEVEDYGTPRLTKKQKLPLYKQKSISPAFRSVKTPHPSPFKKISKVAKRKADTQHLTDAITDVSWLCYQGDKRAKRKLLEAKKIATSSKQILKSVQKTLTKKKVGGKESQKRKRTLKATHEDVYKPKKKTLVADSDTSSVSSGPAKSIDLALMDSESEMSFTELTNVEDDADYSNFISTDKSKLVAGAFVAARIYTQSVSKKGRNLKQFKVFFGKILKKYKGLISEEYVVEYLVNIKSTPNIYYFPCTDDPNYELPSCVPENDLLVLENDGMPQQHTVSNRVSGLLIPSVVGKMAKDLFQTKK